ILGGQSVVRTFFRTAAVQNLELRLGDLQAAALPALLDLAVECNQLAGLEAVAQVFAVKPDALESRPALPGHHFKDGHLPGAKEPGVADLGDHRRHFARPELGDPTWVEPVFVTERQVVEQVFDGGDVLLRQPLGHTRAYAFDEFDFSMEVEHFLDNTARTPLPRISADKRRFRGSSSGITDRSGEI